MRGLRSVVPPLVFRAPISARLYSASSSALSASYTPFTSIPMAGKKNDSPAGSGDELPKLSPSEFRTYNRMAEQMDAFHNHFRLAWNQLLDACDATGKRGLSARQMIMTGLQFCSQLDFHHSIEEQHIFPVLARKMPEFRKELELLSQHKQIHAGLEKLEAYLEKCRSGEEDMRREEVKRLMEAFGEVLWTHLDQEVKTLGADNMRKYWSEKEMRALPM